MIDFENPVVFLLLLMIPLLYFLRKIKIFTGLSFPLTLSNWNGADFEYRRPFRNFLSGLSRALCVAGFICVVFAAASPVVHKQEKVYNSKGSEIIFVVDTSPSMNAKDIGTLTRIEAARQSIKTLAQSNTGSSLGLIEMAVESAVAVPPTMDRTSFYNSLDNIVIGELGDGTALGVGLSHAVFHLSASNAPKKSIVLITDGENNAGSIHPYTAAHLIKEKNISLYVLGIGTKGTVQMEYSDPKTGRMQTGYYESNFDSTKLARLASEGGGNFFGIETLGNLSQALNSISRHESVVQSYQMKNHDSLYYDEFLLAAAILFALAWILRRIILEELL